MRQWDTKKQFPPRYLWVFKAILLGWTGTGLTSLKAFGLFAWSLLDFAVSLMVLIFSPVLLPVCLILEKRMTRRRRLNYLRAQRAADRDI